MLSIFRKKENLKEITTQIKDSLQEQQIKEIARQSKDSLQELQKGRYSYAAVLFENFFDVDEEMQKEIAAAFNRMLSNLSLKNWCQLAEESRGSAYYSPITRGPRKDLTEQIRAARHCPALSSGEWDAVLKIGTFHWNGYYREACLRALSASTGCLRYFYLRMNDWVREVRECAYAMLSRMLETCPLYDIIRDAAVLERLSLTHRRSETHMKAVCDIADRRIRSELSGEHLNRLFKEEPATRNAFYKLCCKDDLFSEEMLESAITGETFGAYRERLFVYKLQKYGCTESEYDRYLHHKCPNIRYYALLKKYESIHQSWDGLETFLTDKASRVRSLAVFILQKYTDFDPRAYYLNLLTSSGNEIALVEIGTYGKKEDAEAVRKYLSAAKASTVKKALHTYGKLMGSDGEALYWRFLCSDTLSISLEAYRVISANRIHYSAEALWNAYRERHDEAKSMHFLYLLFKEPVFERMLYLLKLYCDDTTAPALRDKVYVVLCRRSMYAKVSDEKADVLLTFINENQHKLGKLADELVFDISIAKKASF